MSSTAFTYEGRIDPLTQPEAGPAAGNFVVTIGGWRSLADLAEYVTRCIRRRVPNLPPFSGGPPQRYDAFSDATLTAGRRILSVEPDTLRLFGPVTLSLRKRKDTTPVGDPRRHRSHFGSGDFDFGRLRDLVESHGPVEEDAARSVAHRADLTDVGRR